MQLFAVVALRPSQEIHQRAKAVFGEDYLFVDESTLFVACNGVTTQDVTEKLGLGQESDGGGNWNGIVLALGSYWGYHDVGTWEWIRVKVQSP